MKRTWNHEIPYPEGVDFMDGAPQLEQIAWHMDGLLLDIDAAHQAMNYQRQFARVSLVGSDTGFLPNADGYVNYDTVDELLLNGGGWDGARLYTGDSNVPHNDYPSLWLAQAAIRAQASGSVTALSWRMLKLEMQHVDPVSGELITDAPYIRTRCKGTSIDGLTFQHLVRLEAPTALATVFRHSNVASNMNVLPGSHMTITRIGDCD